jgi:hypothetical protein
MTRFYINDKEIAPPLDASSLNQVLRHIEDRHLPANSVIRKIQIDGFPLIPENLSNGQSKILDQIDTRDKIEIFTGTVTEIAQDSISEALDYLDRIETATPSLITSFQASPGQEAYENLRQLYEGFYWLNLLLDKLRTNFQFKLDEVLIQDIPAHEHHQKFVSILKLLIESQQKRDFVMISDLLEYEILPLVPVWREMFGIVLKKMSKTQ